MASAETRWTLGQWGLAVLGAVAPFVAFSLGANPMPFPVYLLGLAAGVLVFGVLGKPPERRSGLLLTWLLVGALFWTLSAKVFLAARVVSTRVGCHSIVKQEALGMVMYAVDHDDRFPLAESWHSATRPYVRSESRCAEAAAPWPYAMNRARSGAIELPALGELSEKVLLFEADAALPNASGGREWLVFRHDKRAAIGFTDGRAEMKTRRRSRRPRVEIVAQASAWGLGGKPRLKPGSTSISFPRWRSRRAGPRGSPRTS